MKPLPCVEAIRQGVKKISIEGLWGSSKAYTIASMRQTLASPCLVVTATQKQAEELYDDLCFFSHESPPTQTQEPESKPTAAPQKTIHLYSQWDITPYEQASPHREIVAERLTILDKLVNHENILVIAPIDALLHRTIPRAALRQFSVYVGVNEPLDRQQFIAALVDTGYKHVALVENRGEFSVRGGIVDVFPAFSGNPLRVEFFGDTVESLREFDPISQRSLTKLDLVNILPGRELVVNEMTCAAAKQNIDRLVAETGASYTALKTLLTHIDEKLFFPGVEWYAPYFHGALETLFDYFAPQAFVVLDDPKEIEQAAKQCYATVQKQYQLTLEKGHIAPPPDHLYLSPAALASRFAERQQVALQLLDIAIRSGVQEPIAHYEILTKSIDWAYTVAPPEETGRGEQDQHITSTTKRIREWMEDGQQVVIAAYTEFQARRLWEILRDHHVPAHVESGDWQIEIGRALPVPESAERDVSIVVGTLTYGFLFHPFRIIFINEDEFLGKQTVRQRHKQRKPSKFMSLGELELNDYVVHVDHGIGVYLGLKKIAVRDIAMECLQLEYSGGDKLYVPVDRLDLVQKYRGADEQKANLDKLGGTKWARVKERVKASVEKMAKELLETYAARQALAGAQFAIEDHLYREFEATFEFEETPDQAKAIEAVLFDMAQTKPMDRLVCGDVGYGKTEVAMRAACLSVLNGKQVAILVPTTLLAQQHYDNFSRRFAHFPVKIGMLSRFTTKAEQKETVKGLETGTIDIVIGTHRLLQKDIRFKELGLVIIDEEQRFGVTHKEKLRQMRTLVDVLTLTATPIPRTLHMSLMGVRDLSVIETPPEGRLAIRTYVSRFDEAVIYEAITRELDRGGQVFFIHNRVETIDGIALRLSRIVPQARIAIAHGQMKEEELEQVMFRFLHKEFDVLVCTTIVESGLDIPSVNTMIINRAHTFGLAQLYQLRGRIGRSKARGYAYLLVSDEQLLTPEAKKRLRVIQELSELGSGFKLAAHDLEIRGAGSLLGAEQSGHIASLGFDLYCQVIEQTVRELKGQPPEADFYPQIDVQVSAHFPEDYIPDMQQRLDMYKRLMSAKDFTQLFDVEEEIQDRYGRLPIEAQNIVGLGELKLIATQLRIAQIQAVNGTVNLVFDERTPVTELAIKQAVKRLVPNLRQLSPRSLEISFKGVKRAEKLDYLKKILQSLQPQNMVVS